jgi:xanthine dehydrogenase large subunit
MKAVPDIAGLPERAVFGIENERLYQNGVETQLDWETLIGLAYRNRIGLTAQAHYATPDIFLDKEKEKGVPFAYHVTGTAILEVTLDCRRGIFDINSVELVHDGGKSFMPLIDNGQMEGGVVQGIAWMTMEELVYSGAGKVLTNMLSTYKIPDMFSVPKDIKIYFAESPDYPDGILGSKAIGEPPFMYGIGIYFAVLNAMLSFNPEMPVKYTAPLTNEKILLGLHNK